MATAIVNDNFMVCPDCIPVIANGDATHLDYHYKAKDAEQRLDEIEKGIENCGGYIYVGNEDNNDEFSHHPCDCCGLRLAGYRHHCVVLNYDNQE